MQKSVIIKTIIIPISFSKTYEEFLELIEKHDGFKEVINRKKTISGEIDKRYQKHKQNKMESIKIRYAISTLHKQLKLEKLERLKRHDTS